MNSARVGKVLALASPALAVGVVCFMLFATGYSQVSMEERAGSEGDPVEAAFESGWMSVYEYSLENSDYVYFLGSSFIVVICLLAAGAALRGWGGRSSPKLVNSNRPHTNGCSRNEAARDAGR